MYKTKFYKTMYTSKNTPPMFQESTGWGEVLEDSRGNWFEICYDRGDTGKWYATERSTGLKVTTYGYNTIKQVRQFIMENRIEMMLQAIASNIKYIDLLSDHILQAQ